MITAVDIDPVILEVATKYFDFKQDDRMKVIIEDGIEYFKSVVSKGELFLYLSIFLPLLYSPIHMPIRM